jgi:hypothetical protein
MTLDFIPPTIARAAAVALLAFIVIVFGLERQNRLEINLRALFFGRAGAAALGLFLVFASGMAGGLSSAALAFGVVLLGVTALDAIFNLEVYE